MKVLLALVSMFVAAVFCEDADPDPQKVCLPDVLEIRLYNFRTEIAGVAYLDFPNDLLAIRYNNEIRTVFNLTDFSGIAVNETTNECTRLKATDTISNVVTRCLPANSVYLTANETFVGLGDDATEIQAWRIDIPGAATVRVALTDTDPAIPVIREYRAKGSNEADVVIFTNAKLSIDDKSVFTEPAVCTTSTVVG